MTVYGEIGSKDMVFVPTGEFVMGTNDKNNDTDGQQPEHRVYLDAYEIDKYEVTVEEYLRCVAAKKCASPSKGDLKYYKPREPIRMVNWFEARNYCAWISKRLPTEAEWEKAARGPNNYINPWGNRPVKNEVDGAIGGGLANVGSYKNDMSGYGLYDTGGNVSEWAADWFAFDYKHAGSRNPQGPQKGETSRYLTEPMRTVRGGSFLTNIKGAFHESYFSLVRYGLEPKTGTPWIGFRCARSVTAQKKP